VKDSNYLYPKVSSNWGESSRQKPNITNTKPNLNKLIRTQSSLDFNTQVPRIESFRNMPPTFRETLSKSLPKTNRQARNTTTQSRLQTVQLINQKKNLEMDLKKQLYIRKNNSSLNGN